MRTKDVHSVIELEVAGVVVKVKRDFDDEALVRLIAAVRRSA